MFVFLLSLFLFPQDLKLWYNIWRVLGTSAVPHAAAAGSSSAAAAGSLAVPRADVLYRAQRLVPSNVTRGQLHNAETREWRRGELYRFMHAVCEVDTFWCLNSVDTDRAELTLAQDRQLRELRANSMRPGSFRDPTAAELIPIDAAIANANIGHVMIPPVVGMMHALSRYSILDAALPPPGLSGSPGFFCPICGGC